jgi:hypothetical protein
MENVMAASAIGEVHPEFLTRAEASEYIVGRYRFACSPKQLAKLAWMGEGPIRLRSGKSVVYRKSDLDAWALARLRPIEGKAA